MALTGRRAAEPAPARAAKVGLFGTLPILWRETDRVADLISAPQSRHWAVPLIEEYGALTPLDTLSDRGPASLDAVRILVMAQPRPLSPAENVVLDRWVDRGGRVLLFADPMLTAPSAFPLGDKRRPQDVVLLSPILRRWGLRLEFDEDQPGEERGLALARSTLPVRLAGRVAVERQGSGCRSLAAGVVVACRRGAGRVVVVADAALFEDRAARDTRDAALRELLEMAAAP